MGKQIQLFTLCVIREEKRILLGMKKRGFGSGRWNGFGGKVKGGENIKEAAKRELLEEAGIISGDIEEVGILIFEFTGKPEILEVHVFEGEKFEGEPKETEEMKPQWFNIAQIPYDEMWPDDRFWLPLFLAGKKFKGKFLFDGSDIILEKELVEVLNI